MKQVAQAVESIAHAATARQLERLSYLDDMPDVDSLWDAMQDAAELEELRASRSPRRMRHHY